MRLTESEFKVLEQRRSQEDAKVLFEALKADGVVVILDESEIDFPEAEIDGQLKFEFPEES